ncbi:MAG: hypothetical protein R3E75_10325 [Steroidobacteraceae bacterium]|nr:phenylacetate--CoA ligase family protein [Nevskiaceae bacterium]MCP5472477.1 phenylacetate--CoA ligase family protein [Nevskiaceae bacterium]
MIAELWSLAGLLHSERWPATRIAHYQQQRLLETMQHALRKVPFYRSLGIDPASLRSAADLQRFPVLRKADVQRLGTALHADDVDPRYCRVSRTSGSTGQPTETFFCPRSWSLLKGPVKWRRSLTGGLALPERVLVVGEEPQDAAAGTPRLRPHWPSPLALARLSVHRPFDEQIAFARRWRPTTLYAYPSWYVEFLDRCEQAGLAPPQVRRLFTSSERLTTATRARLEAGFGGRVFDVYGSTEFKEVAAECAHGRRHLIFETTWVETLPASAPGEPTELALTTLVNRAMPLLRYALGDFGRIDDTACACGRAAPSLTELRGRVVEFLESADGRRISPYVASTVIETHPAIARYQLLQARPGELLVRYIRRSGRDEAEIPGAALQQALQAALGADCQVRFEAVATLLRSAAGKHRLLIRDGAPLATADTAQRSAG